MTPALYNSEKVCKPLRYMECKRNKWNCEEAGGCGWFRRVKVRVASLDGDEIERERRGIMVCSKWHHCWCSDVKEIVGILLNEVELFGLHSSFQGLKYVWW